MHYNFNIYFISHCRGIHSKQTRKLIFDSFSPICKTKNYAVMCTIIYSNKNEILLLLKKKTSRVFSRTRTRVFFVFFFFYVKRMKKKKTEYKE